MTFQHDVPVPRVVVLLSPGEDSGDWLTLGLELSTRHSEPVARVEVDVLWRRPRPWRCEVCWPAKYGEHDRYLVWRRPRG